MLGQLGQSSESDGTSPLQTACIRGEFCKAKAHFTLVLFLRVYDVTISQYSELYPDQLILMFSKGTIVARGL